MALSYEYSIGSVRAREKSLLDFSDVDQMLSFDADKELLSFLVDKGYGEADSVDESIEIHSKDVWDYLKEVAPDFSIFNLFLIQNDAHNMKVILKSIMTDKRHDELLIFPVTINVNAIKEAVEHKRFNDLPDWIGKSAEQAYDIIARKSDAKECDAVIDRAVMEHMIELSKELGSDFLIDYVKTLVFYNNIKIALRSSRTAADVDFLNKAFCDVDGFRKTSIISAALKGSDYLVDELSKYSEYGCNNALEHYKRSPAEFERYVDDKLIMTAREVCKSSSEGAEPLIGYYLGCEAEKKVIHIISSGIRTKTSKEIIRERLREIYG